MTPPFCIAASGLSRSRFDTPAERPDVLDAEVLDVVDLGRERLIVNVELRDRVDVRADHLVEAGDLCRVELDRADGLGGCDGLDRRRRREGQGRGGRRCRRGRR